jgi:hypothetical protein
MRRLAALAAVLAVGVAAAAAGQQPAPVPYEPPPRIPGHPATGQADTARAAAVATVRQHLRPLLDRPASGAYVYFRSCRGAVCRVHVDGADSDCRVLVRVTLRAGGYTAWAKRLACEAG